MGEGETNQRQPLDYANPHHLLPRRSWTLLAVLCAICLALFGFWFMMPIRYYSDYAASRAKSASNLREIGEAILLYTNDFKGEYPDSFGTILTYEDIPSFVFVSPLRPETAAVGPTTQAIAAQLVPGPHLSYVYLGRGVTTKTVTPDTVVAYELPSAQGTNVLFGDGRVNFVDPAAPLIAKATAAQAPVTRP